jgi:hypothetical protein
MSSATASLDGVLMTMKGLLTTVLIVEAEARDLVDWDEEPEDHEGRPW